MLSAKAEHWVADGGLMAGAFGLDLLEGWFGGVGAGGSKSAAESLVGLVGLGWVGAVGAGGSKSAAEGLVGLVGLVGLDWVGAVGAGGSKSAAEGLVG